MDLEIILVFAVLAVTILLFLTEWFPIDKIAFLIIVSLIILGLVEPEDAISGFADPATVTVLCLMIIAIGLEDNGVIDWLTQAIKRVSILPLILITPVFMLISASISAFISTTAVVIIFIRIVSQLASKYGFSASKLLMPISFAGILGGSCTLMGTSTNLIVNSVAQNLGAERLGFFEFTVYGLIFLAIGVVFMTIASRWLPKDVQLDPADTFGIQEYLFTVTLTEKSDLIGKKLSDTLLNDNPEISIIKLIRDMNVINAPGKYISLKEGDELVLMGQVEDLAKFIHEDDLILHKERKPLDGVEEQTKKEKVKQAPILKYVELLILPGSNLIGKTLRKVRKSRIYNAFPLALQKRKNIRNTKARLIRKDINDIRIKPGDRLLVEMQGESFRDLERIENVAVLNEHEIEDSIPRFRKLSTLMILLAVIGLASSGVLSILASSLTGVGLLLLTNNISLEQIYHKVNWQIVFLLAGMIPLGIAMSNTGTDAWITEQLMKLLSGQSSMMVLGLIFIFTMLLSGTISNNATAIIMTPIAISLATGFDAPLKPFILAVMFAANFSFFTPVGYQTNALIYGTGVYKFRHFLFVGGILSIMLAITATLLLSTLL
ncbi:SLC13 family permease (plasmid) [Nonlabens spongiae]|uniref:SLC13 family permease n=1 Tax=Nonlabens spongiae TaxID=331648 RepID=A0A1W6MPI7_9FLAO|nr:SLC13 family permease [Nonlabens spongiae]ARN77487.1 SLC13 family permease [Nonlabens spongiae]ARN79520.1 SLC13 family permease [Nonlabens spongiae]